MLLFKYDFDGCEFSEVRKEISLYLSVTVCRSVVKLKLALVTGSAAISMERSTADAVAGADEVLLWKTKKSSLPCSQEPVTDCCPDSHVSCPYPVTLLL